MTVSEFEEKYGRTREELRARGFTFVEGEMNGAGTGYFPPAQWEGNSTGGYSSELVLAKCQQWNYGNASRHGLVAVYPDRERNMSVKYLNPQATCAVCRGGFQGTMYDARLKIHGRTTWANCCQACFVEYGGKLGTGNGQLYEQSPAKDWIKTAG